MIAFVHSRHCRYIKYGSSNLYLKNQSGANDTSLLLNLHLTTKPSVSRPSQEPVSAHVWRNCWTSSRDWMMTYCAFLKPQVSANWCTSGPDMVANSGRL